MNDLTKKIGVEKEVWFCGCKFVGEPRIPWENHNSANHEVTRTKESVTYTCHDNQVFKTIAYRQLL